MAVSGAAPQADQILRLAILSTIYVLSCLEDDTVTYDEEFLRYIQSRERYWDAMYRLAESILNAEAELVRSLWQPCTDALNATVPQHHQDVADDFSAAFQAVITAAGNKRSAWFDFSVFAGCLTCFLKLFITDYADRKMSEQFPVTTVVDELASIMSDAAKHVDTAQSDEVIDRLQCEAKWRQYVVSGIQLFKLAVSQSSSDRTPPID